MQHFRDPACANVATPIGTMPVMANQTQQREQQKYTKAREEKNYNE